MLKCAVCEVDLVKSVKFCPDCGAPQEGEPAPTPEDVVKSIEDLTTDIEALPDEAVRKSLLERITGAAGKLTELFKGHQKNSDDDECPGCGREYAECTCDDPVTKSLEDELDELIDPTDMGPVIDAFTKALNTLSERVDELQKNVVHDATKSLAPPDWAVTLQQSVSDLQKSVGETVTFIDGIRQSPAGTAAALVKSATGDAIRSPGIAGTEAIVGHPVFADRSGLTFVQLVKSLAAAKEGGDARVQSLDMAELNLLTKERFDEVVTIAKEYGFTG